MRQINSWEGGMDRDTSKRLYPKNRYYSANNVRILSAQELADGSLQTIFGNSSFVSLPADYSDHTIIGWGKVGKWTILFSTKNTGEELEGDTILYGGCVDKYEGDYCSATFRYSDIDMTNYLKKGDIRDIRLDNGLRYRFEVYDIQQYTNYDEVEFLFVSGLDFCYVMKNLLTIPHNYALFIPNVYDDIIWKIDLSDNSTLEKVYEGKLKLTKANPIYNEVIGYYSNEDVQKIYWADNFNFLRNINIADPDVDALTSGKLDIVPDVDMSRPYLYGISGGNLPVGVVQYAYQLYRNDGSITTFSPVSGLIHLTKSSEKDKTDRNYHGSNELDEDGNINYSGKAVTIEIDNIDLTYDNIRVVNIIYRKLYEEPTINIVADYPIGQSTVRVTDSGESQGTISLNLFRSLGGTLFKAKTIANKDNILFAGNIEESFLDVDQLMGTGDTAGYWDARAYRWNGDQTVKLYTNAETTDHTNWTKEYEYTYTGSTGPLQNFYDSVSEKADAANITNCPSKTVDGLIDSWFNSGGNTGSVFVYKKDGSTLGGEGPNIGYSFVTGITLQTWFKRFRPYYSSKDGSIGQNITDYQSYKSNANPLVSGLFRGYKSDEIYPFGIQFFNEKKQQSFVKWIGDVRFPRRLENNMAEGFDDGDQKWANTKLYPLGIKFSVDTSTLPSEITHFRIVRCERKPSDRTILSQGLAFFPMIYTNSDPNTIRPHWYTTGSLDADWITSSYFSTMKKDVFLFHSPDLHYGNTIEEIDWTVQVERLANAVVYYYNTSNDAWQSLYIDEPELNPGNDYPVDPHNIYDFNLIRYSETETFNSTEPTDVVQQTVVSPAQNSQASVDIGDSLSYINWYETYEDNRTPSNYGPHATTLAIKLDTSQTDIGGGNGDTILVDLKKSRIPYGGYGYYSRIQREYIPCSEIKKVTNGIVEVESYEGDTFLDYTEYIKNLFHDSGNAIHTRVLYPVESSINPKLVDRTYSINQRSTQIYKQIQEEKGVYQFMSLNPLEQYSDFYIYNSVYSKQSNAEIAIPKPDKTLYTESRNLVRASNPKSRFTTADEWTNFASGNELLLESRYGDINKLIPSGNALLFFQDSGFGTLAVNQKAITQSTSGLDIELGSSGVLSYFDYISRNVGSMHNNAIAVTDMGLFWYDQSNKKFWSYTDQLIDMGKQATMQSYFKELSWLNNNMYQSSDIIIGINKFYKELWITKYDGSYETLIFNYALNKFISFLDNSPKLYIFDENGFFDVKSNEVFKNDQDNYTIYGNDFNPEITFIISPKEIPSAIYNVITWLNEKYDGSGNQVNGTTIDSIQFENDHQDSGQITIQPLNQGTPYNTRRYNRVWKFDTIRDSSDQHMTDYYLKVTMKWNNQKFVLHTVETHYRKA